MQYHRVRLIGQDDLPRGHHWALAEHDGRITLFIKHEAMTPENLEEAWAAYRLLTSPRHPRPKVLQPRMESPLLNTA
jgi:hypothetical protein